MVNVREAFSIMSDTGIRSETDRFVTNGDASRRERCAPTRTPRITILVVYPFKKRPT